MANHLTAQSDTGKGFVIVALALVAVLLIPSVSTWAIKPSVAPVERQNEWDIDPAALAYFKRLAPPDRGRPLHLSPFREEFKPFQISPGQRRGKVFTQIGFVDPKRPADLDKLPSDLRAAVAHPAAPGKGLGLGKGVSILQISETALKDRGYDDIQNEIKSLGIRILETRPERALIIRGKPNALAALMKAPFVEATLPYEPAFKIEPLTGRQQLVNAHRAIKNELDIVIKPWSRADVTDLREDLEKIARDRVRLSEDGVTFEASVSVSELKRIAAHESVRHIGEIPEYWQASSFVFAEHPPTVQVGENEFTHAATPYWDANTDGGGCGHCSISILVACDDDADCPADPSGAANVCQGADPIECPAGNPVAPTLVAILDNGASVDAAGLVHNHASATAATIAALIGTGGHRKIAAYDPGVDAGQGALGATCDGVLSGGQTHGNVIAGMIAGNASALGFEFQMNVEYGKNVPGETGEGDFYRVNLDGAARGARLVIQDYGSVEACDVAAVWEMGNQITFGSLSTRLDDAYNAGARLQVLPFGIPNWGPTGTTAAGVYTADAEELDTYLVNHLESMAFVPVGNRGYSLVNGRNLIPDFFDGESSSTNDGGLFGTLLPQISPPSTAKNIVAVGSISEDTQTSVNPGAANGEENVDNYTSKGPATASSLRTAPMMTGVGSDRSPGFAWARIDFLYPPPHGMYSTQSKDNDQGTDTNGVGIQFSQRARGTSFAAASIASSAAIIQDYLRQGFYPTGVRELNDRIDAHSGSLVKAMLGAGTNFSEQLIGHNNPTAIGQGGNDIQVSTARGSIVSINIAGPSGRTGATVIGNNLQGYGRVVTSHVLPIANWPDNTVGSHHDPETPDDTLERPAIGLLMWDSIATGEPPISATNPSATHRFQVLDNRGSIRICLSWPDPPGDQLVNDLDLEVTSPGPNGVLGDGDDLIYDGNVYSPLNQRVGQWGLGRAPTDTDQADDINPMECVHLFDEPDQNPATEDNQVRPGIWAVKVKQGAGGAIPGMISGVNGPDEDANSNHRLDPDEDDGVGDDADGLLDQGGQVYALVVAGPVVVDKDSGTNPASFDDFPQSIARLNEARYHCADAAILRILDGDATEQDVRDDATFHVFDASGTLVDNETSLFFTRGAGESFSSNAIPIRLISATLGTPGNGILEGDSGYLIEAIYADRTPNSRPAVARARIDCEPNFLGGTFAIPGRRDTQGLVYGGCDPDPFFDAEEVVTYSVAVVNNDRFDEYTDVEATLTACGGSCEEVSNAAFVAGGACTNAHPLSILDSPKNIGRIPSGQATAVTFSIEVGAGITLGQVCLRTDLDQTSSGKLPGRKRFALTHTVGADQGSLHYSTDFPEGTPTPIHRDLDRSLVIEPVDQRGLTLGGVDETIQFSSWYTGSCSATSSITCTTDADCPATESCDPPSAASVSNLITGSDESYPALGNLTHDPAVDTNQNGILDRHVLPDLTPGDALIPWNFDNTTDADGDGMVDGHGGWYAVRDAASKIGNSAAEFALWHHVDNGVCGFQTTSATNCVDGNGNPGFDSGSGCVTPLSPALGVTFGAWHTGSGVVGECSSTTTMPCYRDRDCPAGESCVERVGAISDNPACSNYGIPFNPSTPSGTEFLFDYLLSPVIEKVNQSPDKNGFDYTVEFQRLDANMTIQLRSGGSRLFLSIDNDLDGNHPLANITSGRGSRRDLLPYYIYYIWGPIDPYYSSIFGFYAAQYTMGPTTDPDGSLSTCNASATSCTTDAQCDAVVTGDTCGSLTGDETGFPGFDRASTNPNAVKPSVPVGPTNRRPFPGPGEVHVGRDDVAGPIRSTWANLNDYEDGARILYYTPGDAGNRFQIAFTLGLTESTAGSGDGDFGVTLDDIVFEWDEVHPVEDPGPCQIGADAEGPGGASLLAGHPCSTLSVDRTNLYECNETLAVTVNDTRYQAGAPPAFARGDPGAPDSISIHAWSNSEPFPGEIVMLTETGNATGVFIGKVGVSSISDTSGVIFTVPATEQYLFFAYEDDDCDSNFNGQPGQSDFQNLDGDGVVPSSGRDGICGTSDDEPSCFGPDGMCGYNPYTGAIDDVCPGPTPADNCPTLYNPSQADLDGDGVGGMVIGGVYEGCDNCPHRYNPAQIDSDFDGVGDACDSSDIDGDGIPNDTDNCPDIPNTNQNVSGSAPPRGQACAGGSDLDGDGVSQLFDNCPGIYNSQADTDGDPFSLFPLGDACDGDCLGECDGTGSVAAGTPCTWGSAEAAVYPGIGDECGGGQCINRVCSTVDEDADLDEVTDPSDNCPVMYNPTIVPGSQPPVQADVDRNNIGDACDPAGHFDENRDGIPDDVGYGPFFAVAADCSSVPLAEINVLSVIVRDEAENGSCVTSGATTRACTTGPNVGRACTTPGTTDPICGAGESCMDVANACGDGDAFADPGEIVRVSLFLQNVSGRDLSGVLLSFNSADPDVACVLDAAIAIPEFPQGSTVDTSTLSNGDFRLAIDQGTTSPDPAGARISGTVTLTSSQASGTSSPVGISFLADLDLPAGAAQLPLVPPGFNGRCDPDAGAERFPLPGHVCDPCLEDSDCCPASGSCPGACRAGLICEDFESPGPAPTGTGGISQNNDFSNTIGLIQTNAVALAGDQPIGNETVVVGTVCFGFLGILGRTASDGCQIDPDFDTDWHIDVSNELGGATPLGSAKAFDGNHSAHWGRHTNATSRQGDTTPLRQIEAFVTEPINLTITPAAGDLYLTFYHLVSFADNNSANFGPNQAGDHGSVQITVDVSPPSCSLSGTPCAHDGNCPVTETCEDVDAFGRWQRLEPFQNVYEHTPNVFSWFPICQFTPSDGGDPESPETFVETTCFPDLIWSHSGNVVGSDIFSIHQAQGPGVLGSYGDGVWVKSAFNLGLFIGQRVKIRWIGQSWEFFAGWDSYMEPPGWGAPFDVGVADDGWWVDQIRITGAADTPVAPVLEPDVLSGDVDLCPTAMADSCDEGLGADNGFDVVFNVIDSDGDGVISPGESITLDALQTTNPGGCADGVPQFRFTKAPYDGSATLELQDWSTAPTLTLGNQVSGDTFRVEVRCSSDTGCTTSPTGPPVGAIACGGPKTNVAQNPIAPDIPVDYPDQGFVAWNFGAACPAAAAICGAVENFLDSTYPAAFHQPPVPPAVAGTNACFDLMPQTYGHGVVRSQLVSVAKNSALGPFGFPPLVFDAIDATDRACGSNVSFGTGGSCDFRGVPRNTSNPPPVSEPLTCGDMGTMAVGQVAFYQGVVHTTSNLNPAPAPPFGCALPSIDKSLDPDAAGRCYLFSARDSSGAPTNYTLGDSCP